MADSDPKSFREGTLLPPSECSASNRSISAEVSDGEGCDESGLTSIADSPLQLGESAYERLRRKRIERNQFELDRLGLALPAFLGICGVNNNFDITKRKPRAAKGTLAATRRSQRISALPTPTIWRLLQ